MFRSSHHINERLGWADDGIKALTPTVLQYWVILTCVNSHRGAISVVYSDRISTDRTFNCCSVAGWDWSVRGRRGE